MAFMDAFSNTTQALTSQVDQMMSQPSTVGATTTTYNRTQVPPAPSAGLSPMPTLPTANPGKYQRG